MTEERHRPQYGEYATPEQQAKAAGLPYHPPAPDATARVDAPPPVAGGAAPGQSGAPGGGGQPARAFSADRLATLLLLGIGLFSLINAIPQYLKYSAALNAIDTQLGVSAYSLPALADKAGIGLLIAHVVIFVLTAWWALRALSRHRRAFYIPVLGFVVFGIVYVIVLTLLFREDPALSAQLATRFG